MSNNIDVDFSPSEKDLVEFSIEMFVGLHVDEKVRDVNARAIKDVERASPPVEGRVGHEEKREIRNGEHEPTRAEHERHPQHHDERFLL